MSSEIDTAALENMAETQRRLAEAQEAQGALHERLWLAEERGAQGAPTVAAGPSDSAMTLHERLAAAEQTVELLQRTLDRWAPIVEQVLKVGEDLTGKSEDLGGLLARLAKQLIPDA